MSRRHGLRAAKTAAKELGVAAISRSTASGRALLAWREAVVSDLGGPENVPATKLALLDVALVARYVLGTVDAWILGQETLIKHRDTGEVHLESVVLERGYVANLLRNLLTSIGLERQQKQLPKDLRAYLTEAAAAKDSGSEMDR